PSADRAIPAQPREGLLRGGRREQVAVARASEDRAQQELLAGGVVHDQDAHPPPFTPWRAPARRARAPAPAGTAARACPLVRRGVLSAPTPRTGRPSGVPPGWRCWTSGCAP